MLATPLMSMRGGSSSPWWRGGVDRRGDGTSGLRITAVSDSRRVIGGGDRMESSRREMNGGASSGNWLIKEPERSPRGRPLGVRMEVIGGDAPSTARLGPGDEVIEMARVRPNPPGEDGSAAPSELSAPNVGRGDRGGLSSCASKGVLYLCPPPPPPWGSIR